MKQCENHNIARKYMKVDCVQLVQSYQEFEKEKSMGKNSCVKSLKQGRQIIWINHKGTVQSLIKDYKKIGK